MAAQLRITVRPYQVDLMSLKSDENVQITETAKRSTPPCKEQRSELRTDGSMSKRLSTR